MSQSISNINPGELATAPVDLPIGTPLRVDIQGVAQNLNSVLVGIDPERHYWIVRTPDRVVAERIRLLPGDEVMVRFLHHGTAMGSNSGLLSAVHDPAHLLFITIPRVLAEHNLRNTPRNTSFLPARLAVNEATVNGSLHDIGQGGCRFFHRDRSDDPLPELNEGDRVTVHFKSTGLDAELAFPGEVRGIHEEPNRHTSIGVRFDEFTHENQYRAVTQVMESQ